MLTEQLDTDMVRPEGLPGERGVFRGDQIGIDTAGAFLGQSQHLGSQGGEHPVGRRNPGVADVELVEMLRHACEWPVITTDAGRDGDGGGPFGGPSAA